MARLDSFYLQADRWPEILGEAQGDCLLEGPEAHHLVTVLRTTPGSRIRLFDGQGREGFFSVAEVRRKAVLLVGGETSFTPRPSGGVVLALGFGRAARRDVILEKAVELGARGLVFWQAARTQGAMPQTPKPTWTDKLVAAAKQCGRPWLPELAVASNLSELLAISRSYKRKLLFHEAAHPEDMLTLRDLCPTGEDDHGVLAAVGPEGGLTDEETAAFTNAQFQTVSLGRSVLRWETAALVILAMAHMAACQTCPGSTQGIP